MIERLSFRFKILLRYRFALFTSLKQCIHLNIHYYVSRSYLVSYVITNKTSILSLLYKRRSQYFPAKTHMVGKIEIYTAIVSQT